MIAKSITVEETDMGKLYIDNMFNKEILLFVKNDKKLYSAGYNFYGDKSKHTKIYYCFEIKKMKIK